MSMLFDVYVGAHMLNQGNPIELVEGQDFGISPDLIQEVFDNLVFEESLKIVQEQEKKPD